MKLGPLCPKRSANDQTSTRTSSRASACLNHLIVSFAATKGKVLPTRTPTLATVSLYANGIRSDNHLCDPGGNCLGPYQTPTNSIGTWRLNVFLNPSARRSSDFR